MSLIPQTSPEVPEQLGAGLISFLRAASKNLSNSAYDSRSKTKEKRIPRMNKHCYS